METTVAPIVSKNISLGQAKLVKFDEFYTQIEDIERELRYYRDHFRDQVVLLNCDDPEWSNFWRYFELNFDFLGLKKLIATHYTGLASDNPPPAYKLEITRGEGDAASGHARVRTDLQGDGDFRSPECVAMLEEADIVVTNPPFSLFTEYMDQLVAHGKKFVIVGNQNAITYRDIWDRLHEGTIWLGMHSGDMQFRVPPDTPPRATRFWVDETGQKWRSIGNACWFTNLDIPRRHEELPLFRTYDPAAYPRYENYDAIEVNRVANIPVDYDGMMGVPTTFLAKHNPDQFELMGTTEDNHDRWGLKTRVYTSAECKAAYFDRFGRPGTYDLNAAAVLREDGKLKKVFKRILIRRTA